MVDSSIRTCFERETKVKSQECIRVQIEYDHPCKDRSTSLHSNQMQIRDLTCGTIGEYLNHFCVV